MFKIGVVADSFRLPIEQGILQAAELGLDGIQMYATYGEMAVGSISAGRINELKKTMKAHNITVSALCGDFMGAGFTIKDTHRLEQTKKVIDLAIEFETGIVTSHIGTIPDTDNETRRIMLEGCAQAAEYAASRGAVFAVETGTEPAEILKCFLTEISSKGIGVNFDPANLVMVAGVDPVNAVYILKDFIVHTHAKDGKKLTKNQAEKIYGAQNDREHYYIEMPLGQGNVDYEKYIAALADIGYSGFLTIEREVGENPVEDIVQAIEFLRVLTQ